MVSKNQMVVVDGVRYRPDDAPKKQAKKEPEAKQSPAPANKARAADHNK